MKSSPDPRTSQYTTRLREVMFALRWTDSTLSYLRMVRQPVARPSHLYVRYLCRNTVLPTNSRPAMKNSQASFHVR